MTAEQATNRAGRSGWSLYARIKERVQQSLRRHVWRTRIGAGTVIAPSAYVDRTWPKGIHIGRDCWIGEEAVVLSHDFTRGLYLTTRIGDRCMIGARAIVMPGVAIGDNCVLLPGAVVVKDMPDGHSALGNPAVISRREDRP